MTDSICTGEECEKELSFEEFGVNLPIFRYSENLWYSLVLLIQLETDREFADSSSFLMALNPVIKVSAAIYLWEEIQLVHHSKSWLPKAVEGSRGIRGPGNSRRRLFVTTENSRFGLVCTLLVKGFGERFKEGA